MKLKNGNLKCIICYVIAYISCTSSKTEYSCEIDYRGKVIFAVKSHYDDVNKNNLKTSRNTELKYYYRNNANSKWTEAQDCARDVSTNSIKCVLHELSRSSLSGKPYDFMLVSKKNDVVKNTTKFYIQGRNNNDVVVTPLQSITPLKNCNYSVGTKLLTLSATANSIKVHWFLYPVTLEYKKKDTKMSMIIRHIDRHDDYYSVEVVNRTRFCRDDSCTKIEQNLLSCQNYNICIKIEHHRETIDEKCRTIRTYCRDSGTRMFQPKSVIHILKNIVLVFSGFAFLICFMVLACGLKINVDMGKMFCVE